MNEQKCDYCGTPRSQLNEAPWGLIGGGIQCQPCHNKEHEEAKQKAIAEAKANGHDELDCSYNDVIICPVCASVNSNDDIHESTKLTCEVCDTEFEVEVDYSVTYTTRKAS